MSKSRTLFQKSKRTPSECRRLQRIWDTVLSKASSATMVLAAPKKFGLLEDEGARDTRQVRLTQLAVQILADVRETSPSDPRVSNKLLCSPSLSESSGTIMAATCQMIRPFGHS